jgi:Acetyltransferase (GNAT) domain
MHLQLIQPENSLWLHVLDQLCHDFYHKPEYLRLEAKRTHSRPEAVIAQDGDKTLFLPYLVRHAQDVCETVNSLPISEVSQVSQDITSPYGYPGFLLSPEAQQDSHFLSAAIQQILSLWEERNICSAFIRLHPILNHNLQAILPAHISQVRGETISIDLTLSEHEIVQQTRSQMRRKISQLKQQGFTGKVVNLLDFLPTFIEIYEETMHRVSAASFYYFNQDYYHKLAEFPEVHLGLVEYQGQITCAGIFTECCGILQYHLGGTSAEFLSSAPNKVLIDYMRFWAKHRGNRLLHLGGGVGGARDGLYQFKAGFSDQRHSFLTLCFLINPERYYDLVNSRARMLNVSPEALLSSGYFPAYRISHKDLK